jgi:cyclophilin family peptidyl-prolyl cis-trans isomerase
MVCRIFGKLALASVLMLALVMGTGVNAQAAKKTEKKGNPVVKLETSMGEITLELYPEKAPVTVANFLQYVKDGFYNGTIFHRVIDGFMMQGGGFDANLSQKPTRPPIKIEADNGLSNDAYTVAMARTPDPDSATAQFFLNFIDNKFLNYTGKTQQTWGYTVFGKVVKGKEVVDKIKAVPTATKGGHQNVPVEPVTIIKATVVKK